jgi:hypothetical protein
MLKFNPRLIICRKAKQIPARGRSQLSQDLGSANPKMLPDQILISEKPAVAISFWRHPRQGG